MSVDRFERQGRTPVAMLLSRDKRSAPRSLEHLGKADQSIDQIL
jgi:hypothetical protein